MDVIRINVIDRLNKLLGSDVKNLSQCQEILKTLQKEKCEIEKMLSFASDEAPSKVSEALNEINKINDDVGSICSDYEALKNSASQQQVQADTITSYVQEKIDKIQQLERLLSYFKIIHNVQNLSTSLEESLAERDDTHVITEFTILSHLCIRLRATQCSHLASYLKEVLHYWHNVLKDKFSLQFDEAQKSVRWPLLGDNTITVSPTPEALSKFQTLVKYFILIQLPSELTPSPVVTSSLLLDNSPLSLPIMLLLKPLRKRFVYHFCGKKQTNRADKPEWYLTQVLTWIRDHEQFVEKWVQPVFDKTDLQHITAKIEVMRGLVELVIEKLHSDLPQLQFDDGLFSHTVDEALGFDRELRDSYDYPKTLPSAVSVITQAPIFVKWIQMERKYARDKMDAMFNSETAWLPVSSIEIDDLKVTEIGEAFILLLSTMTDRYSTLPQPGHRLQFLELQLELIDDFRVRLFQLLHSERQNPLGSRMPAILNTSYHLVSILNDWGSNTHFLLLKHYKTKIESIGEDDNSKAESQNLSVFEDALNLLQRLVDELLNAICEAVMFEVKAKSRPYRHDKWFALTLDSDKYSVLPSACPMFQVLVTKLNQLKNLLAVPLFDKAWQIVSSQLATFLLEEVILQNKFNEGGAKQLMLDITRTLIPIFRQYTPRPESYFIFVKEACALLTLQPFPRSWELEDVEKLQFEIHHLSPSQIHDIIHRRIEIAPDLM